MWVDPTMLIIVKTLAIAHIGPSQGEADNHDCTNTISRTMPRHRLPTLALGDLLSQQCQQ